MCFENKQGAQSVGLGGLLGFTARQSRQKALVKVATWRIVSPAFVYGRCLKTTLSVSATTSSQLFRNPHCFLLMFPQNRLPPQQIRGKNDSWVVHGRSDYMSAAFASRTLRKSGAPLAVAFERTGLPCRLGVNCIGISKDVIHESQFGKETGVTPDYK